MEEASEATVGLRQALIDVAVDSWRFAKLFSKVIDKLDAAEAGRYVNQLRSFTQGRANYSMFFSHYDEVPANVAAEVKEQLA